MKCFSIPILGVPYKFKVGNLYELGIDESLQGTCDTYLKEINIRKDNDIPNLLKEVVIHEITHALLYEGGLVTDANEEKIPEFISVMFPRIFSVLEEFDKSIKEC